MERREDEKINMCCILKDEYIAVRGDWIVGRGRG